MRKITINNTECSIHFGIGTINDISRATGVSFEEVLSRGDASGSLTVIMAMLHSGLNAAARREGSAGYTEDQVEDMITADPEAMIRCVEIFTEQITPIASKLGALAKNSNATASKNRKKKR